MNARPEPVTVSAPGPETAAVPPLVSVVIPAWNAQWCVGRAIRSVLDQDIADLEIIVVDDGSNDDTAGVAAAFGAPVRLIRQDNGGMSHARNTGIHAARGRYLAFLDADDQWLPGKLAQQLAVLQARPTLAFVAGTARFETPDGAPCGYWGDPGATIAQQRELADIFDSHAAVWGGASTVLARRTDVLAVGAFDATLFGAEDTDLWVRLATLGPFLNLPEPLAIIEKRDGSASTRLERMRAGALAMLRKNRHLLPAPLRTRLWRRAYGGVLCDYAKWFYREGRALQALKDLALAATISPRDRGRLALSLGLAMLRRQRL